MRVGFSEDDERFRAETAAWLAERLGGKYAAIRFRGGPGDEHMHFDERRAWERELAAAGWTCVGWPTEHGGRGLSLGQQLIYHEEYARAGGPGRVGHIGETLLGPTLIALGTPAQRRRFLPGIRAGETLWCQGYSEPNAGSDLANVATRARLDEAAGEWVIDGQKVWTSLAREADWCFVLARCVPGSTGRDGLCYLLAPMRQPGVEVRPIVQMTGTSEFNEVFFDGARAAADDIVGQPGDGWRVAMATLGFERGASTLGQQMNFANELDLIIAAARRRGVDRDPLLRQRIADAWIGLRVMRCHALRALSEASDGSGRLSGAALSSKLHWASWHRALGELAMDALGPEAELLDAPPYQLNRLQALFLFSRADTIYAGSNEIQRNIIAERGLGMPRERRGGGE